MTNLDEEQKKVDKRTFSPAVGHHCDKAKNSSSSIKEVSCTHVPYSIHSTLFVGG